MRIPPRLRKRKGKGVAILGALACSLAMPASAQSQPTVQELLKRLEALEQRVGDAPAPVTAEGETGPATLGDLDQRLRILERRLELQQEETAIKAKDPPVLAVNDKPIRSVEELRASASKLEKGDSAALLVERDGVQSFVSIRAGG